jgi:riboflavin transporter
MQKIIITIVSTGRRPFGVPGFFIVVIKNQEDDLLEVIKMNFSHTRVQRLAVMACMSALAFILMLFEFPVIPVVSYLKMDFSDLPILITTWLYGPVAGIVVAAIKCLLHGLMYGLSVGELLGIISNLLSSLSLLIPFAWFMRRGKGGLKRRLVMGGIVATVTLTVVMSLLNYFVLTPLYMALWGWKPSLPLPELVAFGVIPFNLIKGVLISLIFGFLAWSLRNWVATKLER